MSNKPHIIILFAGRYPSEKAAGLFVDLNARALVDAGARVTVLAPRRLGRTTLGDTPYTVRYLPTIDLSRVPLVWNIANFISVYVFAKWAFLWLWLNTSKQDAVISNDAWPLLVATLIRKNTMYEMHDFAKHTWMYRTLLRRVRYVLVTNEWKRRETMQQFGVPEQRMLLERNAVDTERFGTLSKEEARRKLSLPLDSKIVVYTGHLYEWKGATTLADAAALVPDAEFIFVGGTASDVASFRNRYNGATNIRLVGHVDHNDIPAWQSAADVLVLPNSGKEEISVHYTSPMKLFEYMASERPIVASDLPSIREVLGENGYYAQADVPASFAKAIQVALRDDGARVTAARGIASSHSWRDRARRLMSRFEETAV